MILMPAGAAVAVRDQAPAAPAGFQYRRADVTDGAAVRRADESVAARLSGLVR